MPGLNRAKWNLPNSNEIEDTDQLRNVNSFDYLKQIVPFIPKAFLNNTAIQNLLAYCSEEAMYDESYPYGDLYTVFMTEIEDIFKALIKQKSILLNNEEIIDFQIAIYENENESLITSYEMAKKIIQGCNQTTNDIENNIYYQFEPKYEWINQTTPTYEGSVRGRVIAFFASNYRPQTQTNISQLMHYAYQDKLESGPKHLRMGTQGQYVNGEAGISPLFEGFRSFAL